MKTKALKCCRELSSSSKNIGNFSSIQCALISLDSKAELNYKGTIKLREQNIAVLYEIKCSLTQNFQHTF